MNSIPGIYLTTSINITNIRIKVIAKYLSECLIAAPVSLGNSVVSMAALPQNTKRATAYIPLLSLPTGISPIPVDVDKDFHLARWFPLSVYASIPAKLGAFHSLHATARCVLFRHHIMYANHPQHRSVRISALWMDVAKM